MYCLEKTKHGWKAWAVDLNERGTPRHELGEIRTANHSAATLWANRRYDQWIGQHRLTKEDHAVYAQGI